MILHLYSPRACPGCGAENRDGSFCPGCAPEPLRSEGRCSRCFGKLESYTCGFCDERNVLFDRHISTFGLNAECKRVLQNWKFENERNSYQWFRPYLEHRLAELLSEEDIIQETGYLIYVGSGRSARNIRNYQPVADMGRQLATDQLPLKRMLQKKGKGKQSGFGRHDRFFQVKDSIQLTVEYRPAFYYVLLEDVFTTGATALEASRILKRESQARVFVLSLFMAD